MTQEAACRERVHGRSGFGGFAPRAVLALCAAFALCAAAVLGLSSAARAASPTIEADYVTDVASTSASLGAAIDPNETPVTYYFQYGPSVAYGSQAPTSPVPISAAAGESQVSQHVEGLQNDTLYHYRVVVIGETQPGEFTTFDGPDQTFHTQGAGNVLALPDGRKWEMVSPPDKHGAPLEPPGEMGTQAAADGDAMAYLAQIPTEAEPAGDSQLTQVLSRRTARGWESLDISSPHTAATGHTLGRGQEYRLFSEDLSLGVLQPRGAFDPSLSPEASEQTAYLRADFLNGDLEEPCLKGCYRPLVTGAPGYANVPSGTVFGLVVSGSGASCRPEVLCGPEFVNATPDFKHIVLTATEQLTNAGPPQAPGFHDDLYEWSNGALTYVGEGVLGSSGLGANGSGSSARAISADGSRVFFTEEGGKHGLFMRNTATGALLQLDAVQGGTGAGSPYPLFQTASGDGSRVFFTDTQRLTADSSSGASEVRDLYECRIVEAPGGPGCALTDLTPPPSGSENAAVAGAAIVSEDGAYVYFAAAGVLAPGAVPGTCYLFAAGTCNLYLRHEGTTKLVAVLSSHDESDWTTNLSAQTARVSPDGRWLAFMSPLSLTGYDTRDAVSGKPDEEVYLYDAGSGALACASCNPTGARPQGFEMGSEIRLAIGVESKWQQSTWFAANIPGWAQNRNERGIYQPRYLSDSGRLFFNSNDALVPQDVNGTEDVYQYEPPGVGSCTSASATFSELSDGCIDLVSSGTSAEESAFLDASEGGGDAFFLTAARLAPQDFDTSLDIYDARECTVSSPCLAPPPAQLPPCDTADACKPAPTPQPTIYGAPSSATFSGAGNIVPESSLKTTGKRTLTRKQNTSAARRRACRKMRVRRARKRCEKRVTAGRARPAATANAHEGNHKYNRRGSR